MIIKIFAFLLALLTLPLFAVEAPAPDLNKIEEALKSAPDDPMLHYRKCQALFARGREQQAIDHAAVALAKFKARNDDLSWMNLGSIETDRHRIDVHYNMGPKERAAKKDGIVRPYSFRVWTTEAEPKLLQTIDFELAYLDGELLTAAIGEKKAGTHYNYGILNVKSDFAAVKKKVLQVIEN